MALSSSTLHPYLKMFKETNIGKCIALWYYRYSVMTGEYVLTNLESCILHALLFTGMYFFIRYLSTFIYQLTSYFSL